MRFAIFLGLILCSATASADVVEEPPSNCPVGSTPGTSHTGPYCRPAGDCTSDSACATGTTCDSVSQCIETRGCGGLEPPDAMPCTLEHVVGPCNSDGSCAVGVCRVRDVCGGASSGGGCGCSVGEGAGGGALALAVALMLFAMRRSRL